MPDLTCLGKIIGGGLPVGAYGGRRDIMEKMAPEGDIYQAGTLSGNPLAMTAGLATLKVLQNKSVYQELEEKGRMLFSGLEDAAKSAGVKVVINRIGSMGSLFFGENLVTDFASAKASDADKYKSYYAKMLEQGIYLAPSPFEACFVSTAHDENSIQKTIDGAATSFDALS
jgi:glutamate-1-semialdehyde 2,1-aminomutase